MSDPTHVEFGRAAAWTAEAAQALGREYHLPAACMGSGSPHALDWLLDHMTVGQGDRLLDSGAGLGGPSAYAAQHRGVIPLLIEPEIEACTASRGLFDLQTTCADAMALPVEDGRFDAAWSLGVLCTVADRSTTISELARATKPSGRVGLIVYVARQEIVDPPGGNDFPSPANLTHEISRAKMEVIDWIGASELPAAPPDWADRADAVSREVGRTHADDPAYRVVSSQQQRIAELLDDGAITAELLCLRRRSNDSD